MLVLTLSFSCDDEATMPAPEVTSITPTSGQPNTVVAISGKFFHPTFSENKVKFNGKDAIVSNATTTQINVVVPLGAETGPVSVAVNGMTAADQPDFTVEPIPTIVSAIAPTRGRFGTEVTITGANFRTPASSNTVSINGRQAVVKSVATHTYRVQYFRSHQEKHRGYT